MTVSEPILYSIAFEIMLIIPSKHGLIARNKNEKRKTDRRVSNISLYFWFCIYLRARSGCGDSELDGCWSGSTRRQRTGQVGRASSPFLPTAPGRSLHTTQCHNNDKRIILFIGISTYYTTLPRTMCIYVYYIQRRCCYMELSHTI